MPTEVKMPQLGESTYEGTIGKWLKAPGQRVERFEPLVEIITDKVNVEMPAPFGGTLTQILVPEGTTVATGTPIALMETSEAATGGETPPLSAASLPPAAGRRDTAVAADGERVRLSPVVRRLAAEHGLSLQEVAALPGSGAGGRVTKEDVLRYLGRRATPPGPPPPPAPAGPALAAPPAAPAAATGDQLMKLTPLRRSIAQRMAQSKRDIPHAYGVVEADVTSLVRWREAHKEAWRVREGVNITLTAFFVRAAVEALRAFPVVNAVWTEEGILLRKAINIGLGIAVEDGLIVAVIKQADQKSLVGVARDIDRLSRRARDGTLTLEDVQGATFTITNPGVFGSIWSMPIIVPGQAAILATDAVVKRPVVRDDAIAIRDIMHLGLSFDHRVFDGAVAVQFLNRIKAKLEGFAGGDATLTDF
ncbi:MAG: dihydrolipoamide acetyltransferase family protein [Armatimonadota bacterium]|nr:dihydrolipoamide acetyltransferase family protein [Armatimonadota bacterium]MDR7451378.1 dihydrolipoamide acetyltransferase family protein [Armatimonadota bacterium]MDR7466472.1 dihydrolipoamide acetyltransferase family protein [Armatimonadota bacterium]MDR7493194.1 dihydrolipoamide acetyltransferase family protein [Armatimonadota bacterium]MDR7499453.1 dihydrolipoamide acetyltransferase family protein [Armatimonadota bacterium]